MREGETLVRFHTHHGAKHVMSEWVARGREDVGGGSEYWFLNNSVWVIETEGILVRDGGWAWRDCLYMTFVSQVDFGSPRVHMHMFALPQHIRTSSKGDCGLPPLPKTVISRISQISLVSLSFRSHELDSTQPRISSPFPTPSLSHSPFFSSPVP